MTKIQQHIFDTFEEQRYLRLSPTKIRLWQVDDNQSLKFTLSDRLIKVTCSEAELDLFTVQVWRLDEQGQVISNPENSREQVSSTDLLSFFENKLEELDLLPDFDENEYYLA